MNTQTYQKLLALAAGSGLVRVSSEIHTRLEEKASQTDRNWRNRRDGESLDAYYNRLSDAAIKRHQTSKAKREERIKELYALAMEYDIQRYEEHCKAVEQGKASTYPLWDDTVFAVLARDESLRQELTEVINKDGSRSHHKDAFPTHRYDAVEKMLESAGISLEHDRILSQDAHEPSLTDTGERLMIGLGAEQRYIKPASKAQYSERQSELTYRRRNDRGALIAMLSLADRSKGWTFTQHIDGAPNSGVYHTDKTSTFEQVKLVSAKERNVKVNGEKERLLFVQRLSVTRTLQSSEGTLRLVKSRYRNVDGVLVKISEKRGRPVVCPVVPITPTPPELQPVPFHVPEQIQRPTPSIYVPIPEKDSVLFNRARYRTQSIHDRPCSDIPEVNPLPRTSLVHDRQIGHGVTEGPATRPNRAMAIHFNRGYRPKDFNSPQRIHFKAFGLDCHQTVSASF